LRPPDGEHPEEDGEVRELEQMTKAEVAEELLNTVLRLRKS